MGARVAVQVRVLAQGPVQEQVRVRVQAQAQVPARVPVPARVRARVQVPARVRARVQVQARVPAPALALARRRETSRHCRHRLQDWPQTVPLPLSQFAHAENSDRSFRSPSLIGPPPVRAEQLTTETL